MPDPDCDGCMIWEHHQQAIDELVNRVRPDGSFQAVILSGSIAKGSAAPSSDLDVYLVVSEDEYQARKSRLDLAFFAPCAYEGGHVDGKIISVGVLESTAERGTEPMRSSFTRSTVVYSDIGDLQPLVDRIPVYPEANRASNMRDFCSLRDPRRLLRSAGDRARRAVLADLLALIGDDLCGANGARP
jgi:hypothetical protein